MSVDVNEVVITIDKGIPRKPVNRKRGVDRDSEAAKNLLAMVVDDSFFLPNVTKAEVRPITDLARKLKVPVLAVETEKDEVYMLPGVRVWRVTQEDMPQRGREADKVRYWHHPESEAVFRTGPGTGKGHPSGPDFDEADGLVEIDESEYVRLDVEYGEL